MRSFRKFLPISIAIGVLSGIPAAQARKDGAAKEEETKKQDKAGKKKPKDKGKAKSEKSEEGKRNDMVPIPKGHDSKGLKIPYFDSAGKLQMTFNIGVASRLDDDRVQMADLQVETFDDGGASEMLIALPNSVLDLNTRVISAETHVKIWRADFELTGETIQFNTQTKQGKLGGGVRMLIYDLASEISAPKKSDPTKKTP